jgi:hypothetical protein
MKKQTRWYHWTLLSLSATAILTMGILNVSELRYHPNHDWRMADNLINVLLGCGCVLFSAFLLARRNWAFVGAICVLCLQIVEVTIPDLFRSLFVLHRTPLVTCSFTIILLATVMYGLPILILVRLRKVYCDEAPEPTATASPSVDRQKVDGQ